MKVSIVIPCYNMKDYLKETVDSALAQAYKNFEVIVIDDGSTDDVQSINGVTWIRQENQGLNSARNAGAKTSTGDLLLFLDADDKLDPTYLQKTVPLMTAGVGIVSTDMQYFGLSNLRIPTAETLQQQKVSNRMPYCVLIRREAFEQAGGYTMNPDIWAYGDWNLSLSILKRGWRCAVLREPLFNYRIRSNSMRTIASQTHEQMCEAIKRNHPDLFSETK